MRLGTLEMLGSAQACAGDGLFVESAVFNNWDVLWAAV